MNAWSQLCKVNWRLWYACWLYSFRLFCAGCMRTKHFWPSIKLEQYRQTIPEATSGLLGQNYLFRIVWTNLKWQSEFLLVYCSVLRSHAVLYLTLVLQMPWKLLRAFILDLPSHGTTPCKSTEGKYLLTQSFFAEARKETISALRSA